MNDNRASSVAVFKVHSKTGGMRPILWRPTPRLDMCCAVISVPVERG